MRPSPGLVEPGNVASKLRSKRAIVRKLNVYQEQLDRIPLMGIAVKGVGVPAFDRSRYGRAAYGLLTNDSLVLASAENAGVDGIATADAISRGCVSSRCSLPRI